MCSVQTQGGTNSTFTLHSDMLDSAAAASRCAADGGTLVFYEPQEAYLCKKAPGGGRSGASGYSRSLWIYVLYAA